MEEKSKNMIKKIPYSVKSAEESDPIDFRLFIYDSRVISEDLAKNMIEDPFKRSLHPNHYLDLSINKLPFLIEAYVDIKNLYGEILESLKDDLPNSVKDGYLS